MYMYKVSQPSQCAWPPEFEHWMDAYLWSVTEATPTLLKKNWHLSKHNVPSKMLLLWDINNMHWDLFVDNMSGNLCRHWIIKNIFQTDNFATCAIINYGGKKIPAIRNGRKKSIWLGKSIILYNHGERNKNISVAEWKGKTFLHTCPKRKKYASPTVWALRLERW